MHSSIIAFANSSAWSAVRFRERFSTISTILGFIIQQILSQPQEVVEKLKEGVGELIKIATQKGKQTRQDIKLGICGEHGGNPASIEFCNDVGLHYVSCSPYRVPIARLSSARAVLKNKKFYGLLSKKEILENYRSIFKNLVIE